MNIFKHKVPVKTYNIGWKILIKNPFGTTHKLHTDVPEEELDKIYADVKKEIESMGKILEESKSAGHTFVNLNGNVFRIDDIVMICSLRETHGESRYAEK